MKIHSTSEMINREAINICYFLLNDESAFKSLTQNMLANDILKFLELFNIQHVLFIIIKSLSSRIKILIAIYVEFSALVVYCK